MITHIVVIVCMALLIILEIHSFIVCVKSDTKRKYAIRPAVAIAAAVIAILCQIYILNH